MNTASNPSPSPAESSAWQELERFIEQVRTLVLPDLLAMFSIGSLPGGYFRPTQSDLDVVVLLQARQAGEAESGAQVSMLNAQLAALAQEAEPYPLEALIRYEDELSPDPITGQVPNPDLVARLLTQSRQLWGNFPLHELRMPATPDFQAEAKRYLAAWAGRADPQYFAEAPLGKLVKHALILARYYLAVVEGKIEYNKVKICQLCRSSQQLASIPASVWESVEEYTLSGTLSAEQASALRQNLPELHRYISAAITAAGKS